MSPRKRLTREQICPGEKEIHHCAQKKDRDVLLIRLNKEDNTRVDLFIVSDGEKLTLFVHEEKPGQYYFEPDCPQNRSDAIAFAESIISKKQWTEEWRREFRTVKA